MRTKSPTNAEHSHHRVMYFRFTSTRNPYRYPICWVVSSSYAGIAAHTTGTVQACVLRVIRLVVFDTAGTGGETKEYFKVILIWVALSVGLTKVDNWFFLAIHGVVSPTL